MDKKQKAHEYYLKNKTHCNRKSKEWYQRHKAVVLARRKKWRAENLEKDKENKKLYREKNTEKLALYTREYITKRKNEVKKTLGNKCGRCGFQDIRALHIHHRQAKTKTRRLDYMAKGYDLTKIELVCANCHSIEHSEFYKNNNKKYGKET